MLTELAVTDLGVISRLTLSVRPGLTALTGETGAGKTLVVEAIELLAGGRADPVMVRAGAEEATVEGRFVVDDEEVVLARVVPRQGRSRAYVNGRMATIGDLAEWGRRLVDLHGQHVHQSLLARSVQRAALDRFGNIDTTPLDLAVAEIRRIDDALAALGGDERARAREIDLLRFQVDELEKAAIIDEHEDERLEREEDLLAGAQSHRTAGDEAHEALTADDGAADAVGLAITALAGRAPFAEHESRLRGVAAELADVAAELRATTEQIDEDPARLETIRIRRQLLHDLCRKYGETLVDVLAYGAEVSERLHELLSFEDRVTSLTEERAGVEKKLARAAARVGEARRATAPELARAVEQHLAGLAMPKAKVEVDVGGPDPGDEVAFLLAANTGLPALPLAKVASGGELARAMLALRLVMVAPDQPARGRRDGKAAPAPAPAPRKGAADDAPGPAQLGPPTLIFDEVDAGIGGEAAVAVGKALAELARDRQVLVVTHLPQVAAYADTQIAVSKATKGRKTVASVRALDDDERVVELSRMLSGSPDSSTARDHAAELLASAAKSARGRRR